MGDGVVVARLCCKVTMSRGVEIIQKNPSTVADGLAFMRFEM